MPEQRPATPDEIIDGYAEMFKVPSALARAVAKRESGANPDVQPGDGGEAVGMFQLHPGAATDTGVTDRTNHAQNIMGGIKYLSQLSERYKGDVSKTLMAYNGGMEGVDAGTPSPQAKAYADAIISEMTRGAATEPPPTKPTFTDESQPISAKTRMLERRAAPKPPQQDLSTLAGGAVRGAVSGVQTLAAPIRKVLGMEPATPPPAETTTLGKVGRVGEQVAEFVLPATAISKGAKALNLGEKLAAKGLPYLAAKFGAAAVEGAAQGGAAYGVSKAQGRPEGESTFNAAASAVAPIASKAIELGAPALRAAAVTKLAKVFAKGVENAGPEIQYGIKTGQVAPDVKDAVDIVRKAASDTIDLPIQTSWGKWMATNGKNVARTGKDLGAAIKGDLGSEMIFKKPLIDALDQLEQESAKHFTEVTGGVTEKVYNEPLFKQIKILKDALNASGEDAMGYGDMISVRNLSDLKQMWDNTVYGLSTVGKVGVSPEVLTATAQKEVTKRVADGVRALFAEKAPTIAKLNQLASHAYRLEDLVKKLHKVSPGMGPGASTVLHVAGAGAGAAAGQALGGHTLYGIMAGGAMARAVQTAFESPLWQTLSPMLKGKLANALANGQADVARTILLPIIQGTKGAPQPQSPQPAHP